MCLLGIFSLFTNNQENYKQKLIEESSLSDMEDGSNRDNVEEENNKTLLENYGYNAFMTFFQDIPQSIALIIIMTSCGLKNDPDNPTGVSLPGYLDLIPQFGNTAAGIAAAFEASRLIAICKKDSSADNVINAILYTIFSASTIFNGLANTIIILSNEDNRETHLISTISTFIALIANFLILCREEIKLTEQIYSEEESNNAQRNKDIFHLVCSFNLNVSIVTSFLVTLGKINRNLGAYGYLFGTWFGQVPELIEPTIKKINNIKSDEYLPVSSI
jgi:hypothetical protein